MFGAFFGVDAVFVAGNMTKIADGAWVPLTMAAAIFLVFIVWHDGRERLGAQLDANAVRMKELPKLLAGTTAGERARRSSSPAGRTRYPARSCATWSTTGWCTRASCSCTSTSGGCRRSSRAARLEIDTLRPSIYSVRAHYGFMEDPDVMEIIQQCNRQGLRIFARDYTLFLGQHVVMPLEQRRAQRWQRQFFAWLQRRSVGAAEFFGMPLRRVVILSTVVEI